jgi:hypothetical protein
MPTMPRPQHQPTDDWAQLRLLVSSPEQETYELLRPIVLFGQPTTTRAEETGVAARTLRRKVARFAAIGMRSLFEFETDEPPAVDRRTLPLGIRKAIVELKAEYPPLKPFAIARICQHRFDRPVSYHTVAKVLATDPLPFLPPLADIGCHAAQPLAPYRPRRQRAATGQQQHLFNRERAESGGRN